MCDLKWISRKNSSQTQKLHNHNICNNYQTEVDGEKWKENPEKNIDNAQNVYIGHVHNNSYAYIIP